MAVGNLAPIIPAFFTGPNGERLTPDQIKRRQEVAESLIGQATDTSPNAGGWASILSKVGLGLTAGYQRGKAERGTAKNAEASKANLQNMYGSLIGGSTASATPAMGGLPAMASGTGVGGELAATAPGGASASTANLDVGGLEGYIRQAAQKRGIDPDIAVKVARSEGLGPGIWQSNVVKDGKRETSYGPFQLLVGGGLGDKFQKIYGKSPSDPSTVHQQIDFALDEAAQGGWGPWYGAAKVGVGRRTGLDNARALGYQPPAQTEVASLDPAAGYQDTVSSPNSVAAPAFSEPPRQVGSNPVASALAAQPAAAPVQPQMAQATMPPINPAVIETLTSPYASAEEKAVAQALLGQYQQKQAAVEKQALAEQQRQMEIQRRQQIAQQTGIDPAYAADDALWEGAAGNLFAAPSTTAMDGRIIDNRTGQPIYQAPAQNYRQVYGEEAAAMGLDPTKAYNIGPDGKIAPIGEGGVTVNNNMGADQFEGEFAKLDAKALSTVATAGLAAQRNLGRIDQLEGLLKSSPGGSEAAFKQALGEWGIPTEGLDNLQAAQAAINSLVPEQRQEGSGPMSDADLALFKQSLPRTINQPGGNQLIIGTMRAIAQYDAEGAAIVQQLRNGDLNRAQAFEMLQSRQNPLESFKAPTQQENPLPAQTNGRKTSTGATWEVLD